MKNFHRSPVLFSIIALLLTACAYDPQPVPVASVAPPVITRAALPAPAPVEYVSSEEYFRGRPDSERIPESLAAATEGLRAAAIRNIFENKFASSELSQAKVFFLAVGPNEKQLKNPSEGLLGELLKGARAPFKKFSECIADDRSVRDAASGARGVLFRVTRICWTGPHSALLEYGYSTGGIHGMLISAEAELSGGVWSFTMRKMNLS